MGTRRLQTPKWIIKYLKRSEHPYFFFLMRNMWTLLNIRKQHSTLNHQRFNERWTIFHPSYKKINVFCICRKGICRFIGLSSHMRGFKGSKLMQPITCPRQYRRDGYWGSSGVLKCVAYSTWIWFKNYEARVWVRVRDLVIFEKVGCRCGGTRRLKNY